MKKIFKFVNHFILTIYNHEIILNLNNLVNEYKRTITENINKSR
jgi:hypothetical protein